MLVKSDAFRPIKVDGNPEHPMSKGKSDAFTQATLLDLYDPDRSQHVLYRRRERRVRRFQRGIHRGWNKMQGGQGLYFLSETITSPTLAAQWKQVQAKYPAGEAGAVGAGEPRLLARRLRRRPSAATTDAQYKLENADVILSLDADFLGGIAHPGLPAAGGGIRASGTLRRGAKTMNRLYAVETHADGDGLQGRAPAGAEAERGRWRLRSAGRRHRLRRRSNAEQQKFFAALSADLKKRSGKCVVIPGEQAPPRCTLAAYALNHVARRGGQDGGLHRDGQPAAERAARRPEVAGRRHERGQGAVAGDAGREPGLLRAGGSGFRGGAQQGAEDGALGSHVDETGHDLRPGTSTRRIIWRAGRMRARTTARSRSFSR